VVAAAARDHGRRRGVERRADALVVVGAVEAEHRRTAQARDLARRRQRLAGPRLGAEQVGQVKVEARGARRSDQRHHAHPRAQVAGQARGDEGHDVRAARVADEQDAIAIPARHVVPQYSRDVERRGVGRAPAPEVAQRVHAHRGDAVRGERRREIAVDPRPAAVAGDHDGERARGIRRSRRDLDEREARDVVRGSSGRGRTFAAARSGEGERRREQRARSHLATTPRSPPEMSAATLARMRGMASPPGDAR
jgi:hypothetical protein